MINFIYRPLEYMEANAQLYGETFQVGGGKSPGAIYFSNPQALQEIFTAAPEVFETRGEGGILQFLLGENSLLLLDGERHQRQRRLLTPPFHGDRMRTYGKLICELTSQVTQQWRIGEAFSVRSSMQELTLQVILQAVFGLHEGQRYEQLRQRLNSLLDYISSPLNGLVIFFSSLQRDWGPLSPWGSFVRQKQQIDQLIYSEIELRRERGDLGGNDILSLIPLSARSEDGIHYLLKVYLPLHPKLFLQRQHEVNNFPFCISQVTGIKGLWHGSSQQSSEQLYVSLFQCLLSLTLMFYL